MSGSATYKDAEQAVGDDWNAVDAVESDINFDIKKNATASNIRPHGRIHLILLTIGFGGLQTVFALQSANGSSQLVSLGMEKYLLGVTWLAGPLAGVFLQPYAGARSDKATHSWGRRRPYILGGTVVIILGVMLLARASEAATALSCIFRHHSSEFPIRIFLAILAVFAINIGIQPVQMGLRALLVDTCVPEQQAQANAWAARITGLGNIVGFLAGVIDLTQLLPMTDQFSALSFLTCLFLLVTIGLNCWVAIEEDPTVLSTDSSIKGSNTFRDILKSARALPKEIKDVCFVQFVSWLGWFPFMFYISTYTSESYLGQSCGILGACDLGVSSEKAWDDATREGSSSMLIFAVVSLATTFVLPSFIGSQEHIVPSKESTVLRWIPLRHLFTLRNTWTLSQVLFGICMIGTSLFPQVVAIKVFVGLLGLSWACTIWIPFALISTAISAQNTRAYSDATDHHKKIEPATVLGIHNVALSAPQAVAACVSSVVFWLSGSQGNGIAWVLCIAGVSGFLAAWATRGLRTVTILDSKTGDEAVLLMPLQSSESSHE